MWLFLSANISISLGMSIHCYIFFSVDCFSTSLSAFTFPELNTQSLYSLEEQSSKFELTLLYFYVLRFYFSFTFGNAPKSMRQTLYK